MIMENKNLTVLRQVVEQGFGNADLTVIDKLVSDKNIEHQFTLKGGKEGLKKTILNLANAFSNRHYELVNHSINGDIVWVHYRYTATNTGPFMGHEATGKDFVMDVMDIARIHEGQIVEHWGVPDRFALLVQLGFLIVRPNSHGQVIDAPR
jgi:predicted SnoaL-like aldol condensation-catalyzing enzyme